MSVKIGVIVGTTRPSRVGLKVSEWFMDQVKDTPDVEFEFIDLADVKLPLFDEPKSPLLGEYSKEHTKKWSAIIKPLDGFVFVTGEYNHGPPAAIKNALDFLYHEWGKKPAAFVGYGVLGATSAIEQLIGVVAQLNMVPLGSKATKLIDVWAIWDDKGNFNEGVVRGTPPAQLMENLVWWAEVLKKARAR